jgi:menaquinone-dependent protoporphyrinogen oxidase
MTVLVAYASRHGATAGIAERIASTLTSSGVPAEARPMGDIDDPAAFDAFVVGAAAYMGHWLREARDFVKVHEQLLAGRSVWLFSSGPLGDEKTDAKGQDVLEAAEPKEFEELTRELKPRGTRVFFGAWDPTAPPVGFGERLMKLMPAEKSPLPSGDFRDWDAIDAWAKEIATHLRTVDHRSRETRS